MAQIPLLPHRNQQLFSDYFLNELLPRRAEWQAASAEAAPLLEALRALRQPGLPQLNEAQLEQVWVRPILTLLGHAFEVQPALKTPDGTKKPDYVLYRDAAAVAAQQGVTLSDAKLQGAHALAVADAKAWGRSLDTTLKGSGDPFSNKNPSFQIAFYVQHSGVDWGILTDGRLWRLYHRDTAHKLDRFYEVDLEALLHANDPASFLYFYLFFRRAAFDDQPLGLAAILRQSQDYARGVGDTLKTQVYAALRHLAQGFLDYGANQLQPTPATLKEIYDNSLIVLYRLLFILYAEARDLLPLRESEQYRAQYSLDAIKRAVAHDLATGRALLPMSGQLWTRARDLFRIIDAGYEPLQVPAFNGGLFDPQRHPFLERYAIGDGRFQQALDLLARVDGQFVDYRDLAERHLGTIYEGLLEFHLAPLDQPAPGFTIDLLNDKGERKSTGSYYTPDYIVKYIIEQTVGPTLRAAVAGAATDDEKIAAVLKTNVLDPAMGSGHFLVEATEYIARFLVDLGAPTGTDARGEAEVRYWKRRVVQSCIYGVDLNPLAVDLAKLSLWLITVAKDRPLSFLDHHLRAGNALVGARIDALGAGQKKPRAKKQQAAAPGQLSLLDDDAFRQSMSTAVDSMFLIESSAGATAEEVKEQERAYARLREQLTKRYASLANLATAGAFGLALDPAFWPVLADYVTGRALSLPPKLLALVGQAEALAAERRFFHWELEFPEVFFDHHGYPLGDAGGFDAVVGNPPYVRQEEIALFKPYFETTYPEVYHGAADLFVYFFANGLRQSRRGGRLAYISSNSWLRANYAQALRRHLRTASTVDQLIDLGDNRVFADAPDVYPAIHIVRRATPEDQHIAQAATFSRGEGLRRFAEQVRAKLAPVSIHDQQDSGWQLGADAERQLFARLKARGTPLNEIVNGRMYYGIKTGLNEAFIIDTPTRDRLVAEDAGAAEIIKPILRGEDLRPWYQEDEGRWLIFTRRGIRIDDYPSIKKYLEGFRAQLEPKPKDWDTAAEWPGRKTGSYAWYELQDSVDYYQEFDEPKLFWPDIGKIPRFSFDQSQKLINDKGFIIVCPDTFMLGILQSRALWFCIARLCVPLGERGGLERYQQKAQFISQLPIPQADETQRSAVVALADEITELAQTRYKLHERVRRRIRKDLGGGGKLNQRLTAWWERDFGSFRGEAEKVFKRAIPLKERDEWEEWLAENQAEHRRLTGAIVEREARLNAAVYQLFDLSPEEIALIEAGTKYQYGEV